MMKILFLFLTLSVIIACDQKDQAGSVGSGAGIQEEREGRSDADGGEDMNITTPIYDEEEE